MKRESPPWDEDPSRWIDRATGTAPEDRAAERLRAARALDLPLLAPGHLRDLGRRRAPRVAFPVARVAVGLGSVLILGIGLGVAGASSGWLGDRFSPLERAPREERLEVAAGGAARLHRPGRWRVALAGPGTATVVDGDVGTVRLAAGTLTVAADAAAMAIEAGGRQFRLAPGAVAHVASSPGGDVEAISVAGQVVASAASPARGATNQERAFALRALGEAPSDPGVAPAPLAAPQIDAPPSPAPVPSRRSVPASRPREIVVAAQEQAPATPAPRPSPDVAPVAWPPPPLAGDGEPEAAWLGRALKSLRRDGDPASALAILDGHAAHFPSSTLVAEATTIRVEALLARGDNEAALDALQARASLGRSLQALRGELLVRAGRCADAARDFSAVLRAPPTDAVDERALRGRAACAALAHDQAGLRADLELYLHRFGDRPFAAEARARLEMTRPAP